MRGKGESTIYEQRLGLAVLAAYHTPPHTQQTLSDYMGITRQRVDQIEKRALRKMRVRLCESLGMKVSDTHLRDLLKSV